MPTRNYLFPRDRRLPLAAVHGHIRIGPLAGENAAVRSGFFAHLLQRRAVVEIELLRERIVFTTALPCVAEPRERTADEEKVRQVLGKRESGDSEREKLWLV